MKAKQNGPSTKARLEAGAAIVAAAQVADVAVIKPRMNAFGSAQRGYVAAQQAVEAADSERRKAVADLRTFGAEQGTAVERMAAALVIDGAPLGAPFKDFDTGAPSALKKQPLPEQTKAVRTLVGAVLASKQISVTTRRAARAVQEAVEAVETALVTVHQAKAAARMARNTRASAMEVWDRELAALKRAASAAADEGALGLSAALFDGVRRRSKTRKGTAPPAVQPAAPAPVVQPPVVQSPANTPAAETLTQQSSEVG